MAMIQRNIFLGFGPQTEFSEVPFFTNWSFIVDRMLFSEALVTLAGFIL